MEAMGEVRWEPLLTVRMLGKAISSGRMSRRLRWKRETMKSRKERGAGDDGFVCIMRGNACDGVVVCLFDWLTCIHIMVGPGFFIAELPCGQTG